MAEVQAGRTGGSPQVTCHELGRLLGLGSCRWLCCVMQGALSLDEALRRPLDLCPICLRKLQHVLGFKLVERYQVSCAPGAVSGQGGAGCPCLQGVPGCPVQSERSAGPSSRGLTDREGSTLDPEPGAQGRSSGRRRDGVSVCQQEPDSRSAAPCRALTRAPGLTWVLAPGRGLPALWRWRGPPSLLCTQRKGRPLRRRLNRALEAGARPRGRAALCWRHDALQGDLIP